MAKTKQGWARLAMNIAVDDRRGRPESGRNPLFAVSPGCTHVAILSSAEAETENDRPDTDQAVVRVFRFEPSGGAAPVWEYRPDKAGRNVPHPKSGDACIAIATAADGAVALTIRSASGMRTEVRDKDGLRFTLAEHSQPQFHPSGALITIANQSQLVRSDARSGAELRRTPFQSGNLPYVIVAGGDVFGWGGWVFEDGTAESATQDWSSVQACGANVLINGPNGARILDRTGSERAIPGDVFAVSEDGEQLLVVRMPSQEEAFAQGKSMFDARTVALVPMSDPTAVGKTIRALPFPQGRVLAWPRGGQMVVAWTSKVLQFDPLRDEVLGGRPLSNRAMIVNSGRIFLSHEDGVRARGEGERYCAITDAQRLIPSPSGTKLLVEGPNPWTWTVLDAATLEKVRDIGRRLHVAWIDESHVVATNAERAAIVDIVSGGETAIDLAGCVSLGPAPAGFMAAFAKKLELRDATGAVTKSWKIPAKPKSFRPEKITQIEWHNGAPWILCDGRIFEWNDGACSRRLEPLDVAVGTSKSDAYSGLHKRFAIGSGVIAVSTRSDRGLPWQGAVVARIDDGEPIAWTGPLSEVVGLGWDGPDLLVAEATGVIRRFMQSK